MKLLLLCFSLHLGSAVFSNPATADNPPASVPAVAGDASSTGAGAQTQQTSGSPAPAPSMFGGILPIVLMFGVVYFFMIRPQQKRMKEQKQMISALKHGDEVVSSSGILGRITGIADKVVTIEVADNVKLKMLKSQVSQVIKGEIKELSP